MATPVILYDSLTKKEQTFKSGQALISYFKRTEGKDLSQPSLSASIKNAGRIFNRYYVYKVGSPRPQPKIIGVKKKRVGDWNFTLLGITPNVIVADKVLPFYDEDKFKKIEKELKKHNCRVFFDLSDGKDQKKERQRTRVEVYLKTNPAPFKEMIKVLEEIIEKTFNLS